MQSCDDRCRDYAVNISIKMNLKSNKFSFLILEVDKVETYFKIFR